MSIYESGIGDPLINISGFTNAIYEYLVEEAVLLQSIAHPYQSIIEACCGQGRYASLAAITGKHYLGVDNVGRYIRQANERQALADKRNIKFVCKNIDRLPEIIPQYSLPESVLLAFPFNSFGIMSSPQNTLKMIKELQIPAVLFSYTTTHLATVVREEYYKSSGFSNLSRRSNDEGVRFLDDAGLDSMAYSEACFQSLFQSAGLDFERRPFGEIGVCYLIGTILPHE